MARPGGTSVTMRDIAASLGISVSAVSLALRERPGVGEELRRTVLETAKRLGYVPDRAAVTLRTGRSGVVGLLIRNLRNPFFLDVVEGFDFECARRGYQAMITSSRYEVPHEKELLEALTSRAIDGLAMAPIGSGRAAGAWARQTGKPAVVINCSRQVAGELSAVRVDAAAAVRTGTHHLLALGHRRIGLVTAPPRTSPDPERVTAFTELMTDHGLSPTVITTALSDVAAVDALTAELARPADQRVTAVLTNGDFIAHAAYQAARSVGLRVPRDLSVIGHDDLPTSALLDPPLTTFRVDRVAIGTAAASALIDRIEAPSHSRLRIVVPGEFVVRGSTAVPPVTE
ncbi:LacI family DNA-binding transcriptional regulator [Pseudonocardia spinosispora]|uniref:LacI family DNA-binding transcriptional regulator n=1 Tax=Pseudonocardia spinosispora TaxID=103441 RepID=UPI000421FDAE|nr:LacI family DNA-binding transcriptional regulator [Pseudonocardia spinosispora]